MSAIIIITTLCCVLPYLWFVIIERNSANNLKKQIKKAVNKENLLINTKEQWGNHFIGIDDTQNTLLFLIANSLKAPLLKINLQDVKSCQIIKKSRNYKKDKKTETELQSLDLEISFYTEKEPLMLNFYDMNYEFVENFEMKRIEKWHSLIQQKIMNLQLNRRAA